MMKFILSFLFAAGSFSAVSAQDVIKAEKNDDPYIKHQADSLRAKYEKEGFILIRESSMNMESEYEMPVILPLQQGTWYQFVFIGEPTSKLYEVRMYDWSEKQVIYQKKMWGDVDGNIISYSYIPQFTEYHLMKPVQVNKKKKKNLPGYVMFFKKVKDTAATK
jgi:hypothetical protein